MTEDETARLEAALALLRLHHIATPETTLESGAPREGIGVGLPLPPAANFVGHLSGPEFAEVVLRSDLSPEETERFYRGKFSAPEWTADEYVEDPFPEEPADRRTWVSFMSRDGPISVTVQAWKRADGGTDTVVQILPVDEEDREPANGLIR